MTHPYASAEDFQFWSRAMTWPAPGQVDPVTAGAVIRADERVVTLGSCFAQHIARHLARSGCTYFVAERPPAGLTQAEALRRNYGVFSARYGNVYTVRQAVQLFDRAFGRYAPKETSWTRGEVLVDPFRPQIEPDGFATEADLLRSREEHLACVREVFARADWLVLTLGLTEAWRDRVDGAVFPLAPGVSGGEFDPGRHEFVNFGVDQVRADLAAFIQRVREASPGCRVMLTVSPVPLAATYEPKHVWAATTYSKSILRVAAEEAVVHHQDVHYFPSYEIITSPAAAGRYYADDLREVNELGVQHVMRLFTRHFIDNANSPATPGQEGKFRDFTVSQDVICDEETIERSLLVSGSK